MSLEKSPFERHECGTFRDKSFDSIGEKMAEQMGSSFKTFVGEGVSVIFTPAQNVNGAVVRTATMHIGSSYGALTTGPTPPKDYWNITTPSILMVRGAAPSGGGGFPGAASALPFQVTIPAGQGLWVIMGAGANGGACVTYDLLP
ncbi:MULTISPECIES: hypothetical protein [unclassified Pseudomonas]|uniref:hypothetical protein n=1 Tax=unclassified Pseudomonas TaxID=196821 RepID=UPI00114D38F4|nr:MULTISPECIES: hypothetical protein [unclassified Pseudomonas]QIH09505.1 hypothetical protein ATY02_23745 [Pseudomonas sp. BIOMIG1BAC]